MRKIKKWMVRFLSANAVGRFINNARFKQQFSNSARYWEKRYATNGTSGYGSYGERAAYKSDLINKFVADHQVLSVTDFGCGDGNQLRYFKFPVYKGLDVSVTAIDKCRAIFQADLTKSFFVYNPDDFTSRVNFFTSELALSLDVIYHLVEVEVFEKYMRHLFLCATRFVIIYAWDTTGKKHFHIRHRAFTKWISDNETGWELLQKIDSGQSPGACDFFIYKKVVR